MTIVVVTSGYVKPKKGFVCLRRSLKLQTSIRSPEALNCDVKAPQRPQQMELGHPLRGSTKLLDYSGD